MNNSLGSRENTVSPKTPSSCFSVHNLDYSLAYFISKASVEGK